MLRACELRPRELAQLRSAGLEPDRVEATEAGRSTVAWALVGGPREQDAYHQRIQAVLPGRLCERGEATDWSREVPASVLDWPSSDAKPTPVSIARPAVLLRRRIPGRRRGTSDLPNPLSGRRAGATRTAGQPEVS